MTSRNRRAAVDDVRGIWTEASQAALDLASGDQVATGWTDQSSLPDMTIGDLVGHLLHSGIMLLEESLDMPAPTGRPMTTATIFSLIPMDPADEVHTDVRSVAASHRELGPSGLLARTHECRARLVLRLPDEPPDRVIALAVGRYPLPWSLDEFIAARVLELVVHLDDLVSSFEDMELEVPDAAVALACHLGIDISMRRHGPVPVMQALYRRDRNSLDALRPL